MVAIFIFIFIFVYLVGESLVGSLIRDVTTTGAAIESGTPFELVACKSDVANFYNFSERSAVEQAIRIVRQFEVQETSSQDSRSQKRCISLVLRSMIAQTSGRHDALFLSVCRSLNSFRLFSWMLFLCRVGITVKLEWSTRALRRMVLLAATGAATLVLASPPVSRPVTLSCSPGGITIETRVRAKRKHKTFHVPYGRTHSHRFQFAAQSGLTRAHYRSCASPPKWGEFGFFKFLRGVPVSWFCVSFHRKSPRSGSTSCRL